jgi:hypothetical protein
MCFWAAVLVESRWSQIEMTNLVGKLGRNYLTCLWLSLSTMLLGVLLVGLARFALMGFPGDFLRGVAVLFALAMAQMLAYWGVSRRRIWGYYLSLALSLAWIASSTASLATLEESNRRLAVPVPWWLPSLFIIASGVSLVWMLVPGARAQFPSHAHKV